MGSLALPPRLCYTRHTLHVQCTCSGHSAGWRAGWKPCGEESGASSQGSAGQPCGKIEGWGGSLWGNMGRGGVLHSEPSNRLHGST